jgi:hypothetical protein
MLCGVQLSTAAVLQAAGQLPQEHAYGGASGTGRALVHRRPFGPLSGPAAVGEPGDCWQVAQMLRRGPPPRADGRSRTGQATDNGRRASRDGDRKDPRAQARKHTALVDAIDGHGHRDEPDLGQPHLAGVRPPEPRGGDLRSLDREQILVRRSHNSGTKPTTVPDRRRTTWSTTA